MTKNSGSFESFREIEKKLHKHKEFLRDGVDEEGICLLFDDAMHKISELKEEKLRLPKEFLEASSSYLRGSELALETFLDIKNRYFVLVELIDFLKINKLI